MPYQTYQSTWNNPYLPINGQGSALGQSAIPAQQMQLANGWQQHWHPVGGALKVNGYQSALQFGRGMPPNCESDPLFDAAGGVFYVVTTDGAGVPTVDIIDYSPHVEQQPVNIDGAQFVSKQEYDQFVAKVSAALEALNGVHAAVPTAGTAIADAGADGAATVNATGGHVGSGQQPSAV
jgi:hypothetical protein